MFNADNLPGLFLAIVTASAVLSLFASFVLLRRYRRAVVRSMLSAQGQATAPRVDVLAGSPGGERREPLRIAQTTADTSTTDISNLIGGSAPISTGRIAVYSAAGLAFALVFATTWNFLLEGGFLPIRFLWLATSYAWPLVMGLCLLILHHRRDRLLCLGIYLLALIVFGAIELAKSPGLTTAQLLQSWASMNGLETILMFCFLARPIRAVGPLVLAFTLTGMAGAAVSADFVSKHISVMSALVSVGEPLGMSAIALLALVHSVGFVLFGFVGWWLLQWTGRGYRAKRTSAQSITMDALFLVFGTLYAIDLLLESWSWALAGVVAFATYKLVAHAGFIWLRGRRTNEPRPPTLLLLRVFSLGRRSERFFDALSNQWLLAGPLSVIAGPDLATSTVQPHEFLDYVGGRLSRRFVTGEADLSKRLAEFDARRDPDGRFRVNEFFCSSSTWQMTFRALARTSTAILMDLRGFSRRNQGCLYEISQLLAETPLEHVLFMVDATTDRAFLDQSLQQLWGRVPGASPNRSDPVPTARLLAAARRPATSATTAISILCKI